MLVVRLVFINAVMLYEARQPPWERLVSGNARDEGARGHRADQIRSQLFGTPTRNTHIREARGAASDLAKEWAQGVVSAVADVNQLVREHANHAFIRTQAGEEDRAEADRVGVAQGDGGVIAQLHI